MAGAHSATISAFVTPNAVRTRFSVRSRIPLCTATWTVTSVAGSLGSMGSGSPWASKSRSRVSESAV
jgi:hypothetical protein